MYVLYLAEAEYTDQGVRKRPRSVFFRRGDSDEVSPAKSRLAATNGRGKAWTKTTRKPGVAKPVVAKTTTGNNRNSQARRDSGNMRFTRSGDPPAVTSNRRDRPEAPSGDAVAALLAAADEPALIATDFVTKTHMDMPKLTGDEFVEYTVVRFCYVFVFTISSG